MYINSEFIQIDGAGEVVIFQGKVYKKIRSRHKLFGFFKIKQFKIIDL